MKKLNDFYCDEVLSGKTKVNVVEETKNVLSFYHTNLYYPVHIVVIPKKHIASLFELEDEYIVLEIINVLKKVAANVNKKYGSCRVVTNLGDYHDSKHLHFHIIHGSHEDLK